MKNALDLNNSSLDDLKKKLLEIKKEMLVERFQVAGIGKKKPSYRQLRKSVASIKGTILKKYQIKL